MVVNIDYMDAIELGRLASRVVLAVGMTPGVLIVLPRPVDGCSWRECWERGIERLSAPVDLE